MHHSVFWPYGLVLQGHQLLKPHDVRPIISTHSGGFVYLSTNKTVEYQKKFYYRGHFEKCENLKDFYVTYLALGNIPNNEV